MEIEPKQIKIQGVQIKAPKGETCPVVKDQINNLTLDLKTGKDINLIAIIGLSAFLLYEYMSI